VINGAVVLDAAMRGERELLLQPHRLRLFAEHDTSDVDLDAYYAERESDPDFDPRDFTDE
jgi:hypothetical protein